MFFIVAVDVVVGGLQGEVFVVGETRLRQKYRD
jgi:hypothetical protein